VQGRVHRGLARSRRRERLAWAAVGLFLVGDVVLTRIGLGAGFVEANPLARTLMESLGVVPAMALLKGLALAVAVAGWLLVPPAGRYVVPVALALPWGVAVLLNAVLITTGGVPLLPEWSFPTVDAGVDPRTWWPGG
jgi:hypothetical protein